MTWFPGYLSTGAQAAGAMFRCPFLHLHFKLLHLRPQHILCAAAAHCVYKCHSHHKEEDAFFGGVLKVNVTDYILDRPD